MKKFNLFGENFSVLGTQQGNVGIINQKLEAKSIKVANVIIISPYLFSIPSLSTRVV